MNWLHFFLKIGELRFSNLRDHVAHLCICMKHWKNLAYSTIYLRMYQTDLHQIFRIGRHVDGDDKTYVRFGVAQGMLLWYPVNFRVKNRTQIDTILIFLCAGVPQRFKISPSKCALGLVQLRSLGDGTARQCGDQ